MQRRDFLAKATIGAASAATLAACGKKEAAKSEAPASQSSAPSAPAVHGAMPEVKWRLTSSFPKSLDTIYGGAEVLANRVRSITGGKFDIRVFAGGEIVPGLQALDAVQQGTVECCHTCSYYYVGKDKTFGFGTSVPFGMNARQMNAWIYFGGGQKLLDEFYAGYNVLSFCYQDSARRVHSIAAQGGINAAKNYRNDGDSVYRLFYDTVKGGDFRAREANVYRFTDFSTKKSCQINDRICAVGLGKQLKMSL